eukprot:1160076-Pelagomonas_calceolata.AAC.9
MVCPAGAQPRGGVLRCSNAAAHEAGGHPGQREEAERCADKEAPGANTAAGNRCALIQLGCCSWCATCDTAGVRCYS